MLGYYLLLSSSRVFVLVFLSRRELLDDETTDTLIFKPWANESDTLSTRTSALAYHTTMLSLNYIYLLVVVLLILWSPSTATGNC